MGWTDFLPAINPVAYLANGGMDLLQGELQDQAHERSDSRNRQAVDAANAANHALQREFAQMGIRWRVDDAKAAGLHPLAALGASGAQASPSFQAFTGSPRTGVSDAVGRMGQNISRAVAATSTTEDRVARRLQLESMGLDNQIKEAELRKLESTPPFPSVIEKPLERVAAEADKKWQEVGDYPSVAYMRSPTGLVPVMPPNLAEALESDQTNQAQWAIRYKGGPNITPRERPSNNKLPPGAIGWKWSFKLQEWQPRTRAQAEFEGRSAAESKIRQSRHMRENWWRYMIGRY